ncbi:MAG: hypothetical protein Q4C20_15435 [Erysipelotrichaceae bacterium]|nr:hypothetical protein [Erysipelotrichaceae bacterium]
MKLGKSLVYSAVLILTACSLCGCSVDTSNRKIPVRVLILPKFEVGEMSGDFPGEAQLFYEEYLAGGEEYEINSIPQSGTLYYKDGIALFLAGQGKVAAALNTASVLSDQRFDFSEAYILSVGCGGSAEGYGIFGDVFVISAAADYDLGHKADIREMSKDTGTTWFHDESFDSTAFIRLDEGLINQVFDLVKDLQPETTRMTQKYLEKEYPDQPWANRQPQVMRGTSVTSDNFWKGRYDHQNALLITETYACRDPYAITEMEDVAVAQAVRQAGLLEKLIILRVSVNMDTFPSGVFPEMLWGPEEDDHLASDDSLESVDIFPVAMQNCFEAGKVLIDAIMNEQLH